VQEQQGVSMVRCLWKLKRLFKCVHGSCEQVESYSKNYKLEIYSF